VSVIGRVFEKRAGRFRPKVGRSNSEIVLALEVMKEAALRQTGDSADVVNRRRRITLGSDRCQSRVEEFRFRVLPGLSHNVYYTN
jgi:hypothetical protein